MSTTYWKSFAGGEVTPELYGRLDLDKYQSGLALARNFITLPHGPALNRHGSRFITYTKMNPASAYSAELLDTRIRGISFTVSSTESYVIELGKNNDTPKHLYFRFLRAGRLVTVATMSATHDGAGMSTFSGTLAAGNKPVVTFTSPATHGLAVGDWVVFHATGSDLDERAFYVDAATASTITLATPIGNNCPLTGTYATGTNALNGKVGKVLQITTAVDATSIDVFDIRYAQDGLTLTLTHPNMPPQELVWTASPGLSSSTAFTLQVPTFHPSVAAPVMASLTAVGSAASDPRTYAYCVTAIGDRGSEESYASNALSVSHNLTEAGRRISVAWNASSGAVRYRIYKDEHGSGIFGFIGESGKTASASGTSAPGGSFTQWSNYQFFVPTTVWTSGLSFLDDNITPDYSRSPPQVTTPFVNSNQYPTACAYFQQRRVFAGTYEKPQTVWLTRTGAPSNFTSSIPLRDDDSIEIRAAARDANGVRHVVSLNDMLVFTQSAVFKLGAVDTDAIRPGSVQFKPQDYVGASGVRPIQFASTVLYAVARGGRVSEITYNWQSSAYKAADASLAAPHLFDAWRVVDLAHTTDPASIAWAVRSDGTLLGFTFMPDENVRAWHQHKTYNPDGTMAKFESVVVISELDEVTGLPVDNTYVVVKRVINGQTVRTWEMLGRRRLLQAMQVYAPPSSSSFYYQPTGVDSVGFGDASITKYQAAVSSTFTTVGGLWHLEGAVVNVLANGVEQANQTVVGGKITLPTAANLAHIGLPFVADFQTLPLGMAIPDGGQASYKNIDRVFVRLVDALGFYAGPTFNTLRPFSAPSLSGASSVTLVTTAGAAPLPSLGSVLSTLSTQVGIGNLSALTAMVELRFDGAWTHDGQVCIRHTSPTPLEIAAIAAEVTTSD